MKKYIVEYTENFRKIIYADDYKDAEDKFNEWDKYGEREIRNISEESKWKNLN